MITLDEHLSSKRYEPPFIDLENKNFSLSLSIDLVGYNKDVLEMGTSTGYVSKILKERGNIITGIEIDPEAGLIARQYCRQVIFGDVETLDLDSVIEPSSFDVILCGDILEHLKNPGVLLKKVKKFLKPGGYLVVSIPNFFHGDVLLNLLKGDFHYTPCGLLDETHLRFFGLKNIYQIFADTGYRLSDICSTKLEIGTTELKIDMDTVPQELLKFLKSLPDSTTYQFIFKAHPSKDTEIPEVYENDLHILFSNAIADLIKAMQLPILQELSVKNQELSVKNQELSVKNQELHELNDRIQILVQSEIAKNQELHQLHNQMYYLETEISSMKKSIVWQFTMKFHLKIIEPLFPPTTRRRRFYELCRSGGQILINNGLNAFCNSFSQYIQKDKKKVNDYQLWREKHELYPGKFGRFAIGFRNFPFHPKISILIPVWNTEEKWLRLAIESVTDQVYENWELCISDGGSTKPHIKNVLNEYARKDVRIKVKFLQENKGIAGNSNEALSLATGDFIGFLDHDDELSPFCLHEIVKLLNFKESTDVIYTDNDKIDESGNRKDPFFKFDFSLPALLSTNYPFHFFLCRRSLVEEIGGLRYGFEGSQDYDLILRVIETIKPEKIAHIDKILYHWRTVQESSAQTSLAKPYAYKAGKLAIQDYLIRNNIPGSVNELEPGSYRVKKEIQGNPRVMIAVISGNKDNKKFIENFNLLLQKTTYPISKIFISKKHEDCLRFSNIQIAEKNSIDHFKEIAKNEKFDYLIFIDDNEDFNENFQKNPGWVEALIEHFSYFETGVVGTGSLVFSNIICNVERPCGSVFCIKKDFMAAFFDQITFIGDFDELQILLSDFSEIMNVGNLYTPFSVGNIPHYSKISQYYSNFKSRKYFTKNMEFYLPSNLSS